MGGNRKEANMEAFDHILNWKLKRGSHQFPGKDGGTCINEAALVAAGFKYRPIHDVAQMPGCFSRPICRFAMLLNDNASDDERQDRKSTRLNSSHANSSYAVFCWTKDGA